MPLSSVRVEEKRDGDEEDTRDHVSMLLSVSLVSARQRGLCASANDRVTLDYISLIRASDHYSPLQPIFLTTLFTYYADALVVRYTMAETSCLTSVSQFIIVTDTVLTNARRTIMPVRLRGSARRT